MKSFIEQAHFFTARYPKEPAPVTYFISVALIIFSLMIFLGFFHLVVPNILNISFASLAAIALLIYYFFLNWRLALVVTPFLVIFLALADFLSQAGPTSFALWISIISLVLGAALQFIGRSEESRLNFGDQFKLLFIAPLLLTAQLFFIKGRMAELREQIYGSPLKVEPTKNEQIHT